MKLTRFKIVYKKRKWWQRRRIIVVVGDNYYVSEHGGMFVRTVIFKNDGNGRNHVYMFNARDVEGVFMQPVEVDI